MGRKLHRYDLGGIGQFSTEDLPADWQDRVEELHQQLMENVAESDDTLLEKFFEEGELSDDEISTGLKGALSQQTFIPVFAVSSATSVGVPQLMDFLAAHAPSPQGCLLGRGQPQ